MPLKPVSLWSATLGCTFIAWLFAVALRPWLSLLLAVHIPLLAWGIVSLRSGFFGRALCYRANANKQCALTFDDGPEPELTPLVLELLQEFDMKATFFVIAQRVQQFPQLARDILAQGHTLACHDLHHGWQSNCRLGGALKKDIAQSLGIIEQATGVRPCLYRPPVGLSNPHLFGVLQTLGLHCVGWSHAPRDRGNRSRKALGKIPALAGAGRVVLLHDCLPKKEHKEYFLKMLRTLCTTLAEKKITAVTVDSLFGVAPYANSNTRS